MAVAQVIDHPEGIPVSPEVDENRSNPDLGLTFYRNSGGDCPPPRLVRGSHTYRILFLYSDYPETVLNFYDPSIFPPWPGRQGEFPIWLPSALPTAEGRHIATLPSCLILLVLYVPEETLRQSLSLMSEESSK